VAELPARGQPPRRAARGGQRAHHGAQPSSLRPRARCCRPSTA
jgi:hypothetical protein